MLFLFPVTVAVTVLLSVAVLSVTAVFAVAVVIAVLALVHVYAVDEGAELGHLIVMLQLVDELEVTLMGEVGSADVDADVGNARD